MPRKENTPLLVSASLTVSSQCQSLSAVACRQALGQCHDLPAVKSRGHHHHVLTPLTSKVRVTVHTEPLPRGRGLRRPAAIRAEYRCCVAYEGRRHVLHGRDTGVSSRGIPALLPCCVRLFSSASFPHPRTYLHRPIVSTPPSLTPLLQHVRFRRSAMRVKAGVWGRAGR